jgi:hypothetical protein
VKERADGPLDGRRVVVEGCIVGLYERHVAQEEIWPDEVRGIFFWHEYLDMMNIWSAQVWAA